MEKLLAIEESNPKYSSRPQNPFKMVKKFTERGFKLVTYGSRGLSTHRGSDSQNLLQTLENSSQNSSCHEKEIF